MSARRVSVIVAAFGQPALLRQALHSLLAQQLGDYEVIVADDSNSAENREVVAAINDSRFIYRANAMPLGPAANHRLALNLSRSPLAAILNHDDLWRPRFLASLVPALEATEGTVVAFSDHDICDAEGAVLRELSDAESRRYGRATLAVGAHAPFFDLVRRQSIAVACAAVFRRDAIPPTEPPDEVGGAYDLWLAFRLASTGRAAWFVPERLAVWRLHGKSLGERRDAQGTLWTARCWERIGAETSDALLARAGRDRSARALAVASRQLLSAGDRGGARQIACRSLAVAKTAKGLLALLVTFLPAMASNAIGAAIRGSSSRWDG